MDQRSAQSTSHARTVGSQPRLEAHPSTPLQVCVGKFDGQKTPSLVCATAAGKLFCHTPGEARPGEELRYLNINRKVSSLASGRLDPSLGRDILLVGTPTALLAYDIAENRDVFFRDAPDGANAIVVGQLAGTGAALALVGGNCSIQGFDREGGEAFWTVTGDSVSAMALAGADEQGDSELLVGSDDFEVRCFCGEEVLSETTETDRPTHLVYIDGAAFAYALSNGTVGVYERPGERRWRIKSKHQVTALGVFDLNGDGHHEVVTGWESGRLEVRSDRSGEVLYKDSFRAPIAGILQSDYRSDGRAQLLVCAADGEVRGYLPLSGEAVAAGGALEAQVEEERLREMQQRKQELLYELRQYEDATRREKTGERPPAAAVPKLPDTAVTARLEPSVQDACLHLVLAASHGAVIRAAIATAERIFEGPDGPDGPCNESLAVYAKAPASELRVPLRPSRDVAAEVQVKALVGSRGASAACLVLELSCSLPRYAMYVPAGAGAAEAPQARVSFSFRGDTERVGRWVEEAFGSGGAAGARLAPSGSGQEVGLVSVRDGQPLWIRVSREGEGSIAIHSGSMEVAGEVLQDLAAALGLAELESDVDFPDDMEAFRETLRIVDESNAVRLQLTAEIADASNAAKGLVIEAEDARILGEVRRMREAYKQLQALNGQLIGEHNKRARNQEQLLEALRRVNNMIQKAAPDAKTPGLSLTLLRLWARLPALPRAPPPNHHHDLDLLPLIRKAAKLRVGAPRARLAAPPAVSQGSHDHRAPDFRRNLSPRAARRSRRTTSRGLWR